MQWYFLIHAETQKRRGKSIFTIKEQKGTKIGLLFSLFLCGSINNDLLISLGIVKIFIEM
jgi:hypothetical protein